MQDVVTPAAADPRHEALIAEVGRELTPRLARADEHGELVAARFRTEPRERPLIAGESIHHEAFRCVPYSRTSTPTSVLVGAAPARAKNETHRRTSGTSLLRRLLNVKATRLGEVQHDADFIVELPHQVLGPPATRSSR